VLLLVSGNQVLQGENAGLIVVSGHVIDALTNAGLNGATVSVRGAGVGSVADPNGFYSMKLQPGNHFLEFGFLGYQIFARQFQFYEDTVLNIHLEPLFKQLPEVEVRGSDSDEVQGSPLLGVHTLDAVAIQSIPALLGEVDALRALQLLPGIVATSEGSSGFSVRGGSPDQNHFLLDGATVYNPGQLLGFFSIFNSDAIRYVKLYKGELPLHAGGRLSSVVEVRSREGNMQGFSGVAGMGLITSRLTLEGPIAKGESSFLASARRSYIDMLLPLSTNPDVESSRLYFSDINLNVNLIADDKNRLFLSTYFGRNVFRDNQDGFNYGNHVIAFRWDHLFANNLESNFLLTNSRYNYFIESGGGHFQRINWESRLKDYSLRYNFRWTLSEDHLFEFGLQSLYRSIEPGHLWAGETGGTFSELSIPASNSLEHAIFLGHSWRLGSRWTARYGARLSLFQNIGGGPQFIFDNDFNVSDTIHYKPREIFNSYSGLEPRLGLSFLATPEITIKLTYSRALQYIHLASSSVSTSPLDVWFHSSPNIKPRVANQGSMGVIVQSPGRRWEHSLQGFIKSTRGAIDFRDHADLVLNMAIEGEIRPGTAMSKGIELMSKFTGANVEGWMAYTLSRSTRQSPWINNGQQYFSSYDRTHDLSLVVDARLSQRVSLAGNWVWFTGAPVTWPVGRFDFQGSVVPLYNERNSSRMPAYHRLDLSLTLRGRPRQRSIFTSEWNFSVYNLYGQRNAWAINFTGNDEEDPFYRQAEKTYLFSVVPSISYTVRF